jgi:hypothetical protein
MPQALALLQLLLQMIRQFKGRNHSKIGEVLHPQTPQITKGGLIRPPLQKAENGSALNAIFEHLACSKSRNALSRDLDLLTSLRVQALTSRTITRLEGSKAKNGNLLPLHYRVNDGLDSGIHHKGDVCFRELSACSDEVDQVSFVHWRRVISTEAVQ